MEFIAKVNAEGKAWVKIENYPVEERLTEHPEIVDLDLGPLGSIFDDVVAEGGILITQSLLISYLAQKDEIDPDALGSVLQAHDKSTGEIVGSVLVDQRLHGPIMSYEQDGQQFLAVAAGGRADDAELLVFALPQ